MAYDAQSQSGTLPVFPIERITAPTMSVSAADDLYQTLRVARHTAQLIPNARLLAFESGGHLLLGHGDEMWPQIAEFMRSAAIHGRWDAARSGTLALLAPLWSQMAYPGW
jgi:pimeloyl-ACP methyl ester carboxylesterase